MESIRVAFKTNPETTGTAEMKMKSRKIKK